MTIKRRLAALAAAALLLVSLSACAVNMPGEESSSGSESTSSTAGTMTTPWKGWQSI